MLLLCLGAAVISVSFLIGYNFFRARNEEEVFKKLIKEIQASEAIETSAAVANDSEKDVEPSLHPSLSKQQRFVKIPVAMNIDNNYTLQLIVALTSMLENAKDSTFYEINILVPGNFREENKNKILNLKQRYKDKLEIEFIDMGKKFENSRVTGHFTKAIFYRLNLPSIKNNLNKILYLDSDIIVMQDLSELYNTDITNYYIAGIPDRLRSRFDFKSVRYIKKIGLKSSENYVNSGVLLMNLEKMRRDNLQEKFQRFVDIKVNRERVSVCPDQDALNSVCFDKILSLPFKFNLQVGFDVNTPYKVNEGARCLSEKEWNEALENPVIIHYTSKQKPWKTSNIDFLREWWSYAGKTPYFKELMDVLYKKGQFKSAG